RTLIPWRKTKSGKENVFGSGSSGILIKTGELRDSFDYQITGSSIFIYNTAPHAQIHNHGGKINHPGGTPFIIDKKGKAKFIRKSTDLEAGGKFPKTKPHVINIPRRKYMGSSVTLNQKIAKLLLNKIMKIHGKYF
ncbi:MAG: phage virion morphogenesis protein, partial [Bacteroidales bacterium]|nr:phage virion morphogenesis protein [Bacteroidales bacterium]